jgi:hypothetical protein
MKICFETSLAHSDSSLFLRSQFFALTQSLLLGDDCSSTRNLLLSALLEDCGRHWLHDATPAEKDVELASFGSP